MATNLYPKLSDSFLSESSSESFEEVSLKIKEHCLHCKTADFIIVRTSRERSYSYDSIIADYDTYKILCNKCGATWNVKIHASITQMNMVSQINSLRSQIKSFQIGEEAKTKEAIKQEELEKQLEEQESKLDDPTYGLEP